MLSSLATRKHLNVFCSTVFAESCSFVKRPIPMEEDRVERENRVCAWLLMAFRELS